MSKTKTKQNRRVPHRSKRLPKGPNGGIELLLIQPVEHLGRQGDVVEVRPGYANNYLLPQGLATIATDHHKRMVEKHRERLDEIERERTAGLQAVADRLNRQSITIEANANDDGQLYGSVGAAEIVAALKANKISITENQVKLTGPLKELGLYTIPVHVDHDIHGEVKIWIVPSVVSGDQPADEG